jgi:hypothetical protein
MMNQIIRSRFCQVLVDSSNSNTFLYEPYSCLFSVLQFFSCGSTVGILVAYLCHHQKVQTPSRNDYFPSSIKGCLGETKAPVPSNYRIVI